MRRKKEDDFGQIGPAPFEGTNNSDSSINKISSASYWECLTTLQFKVKQFKQFVQPPIESAHSKHHYNEGWKRMNTPYLPYSVAGSGIFGRAMAVLLPLSPTFQNFFRFFSDLALCSQ